jgi:hypothetical protein
MRRLRHPLLVSLPAGLLIGLACRELAAPGSTRAGTPANVTASGSIDITAYPPDPIFPATLVASPGDPISGPLARGLVQLTFLSSPPDPIVPRACVFTLPSTTPGMTSAAICGHIQNLDAQTFTTGMLFQGPSNAPTTFVGIGGFSLDTQGPPCSRITFQGTLLLPDAIAAAFRTAPTTFSLAFSSLEHPIAALIGGFRSGGPAIIDIKPAADSKTTALQSASGAPIDVPIGCNVTLHSF